MKKSKVIITIKDHGEGQIEFQCQCQNGQSKMLNDMALHISNQLPKAVHSAALSFYNKKDSNNVVH
ncbi:hypothetical protein WOB69_01020 [Vibrio parahaemolyticus]